MAFPPGPGPTAASRAASVRVLDCDPQGQQVLFRGAMRRIRGSRRMMLRFTLLQRRAGGRWERVRARGLARWKRSRSGVGRFAHRQRVRNLSDGLDYRARVDFRWLDRDGDVVRRERRSSGVCPLSQPLPDLRVADLRPADEGSGSLYTVTVHNRGRAASPATDVRLGVDGRPGAAGAVGPLAPGESGDVTLSGPRCGVRARAVVDPAGAVKESDERNNGRTVRCS